MQVHGWNCLQGFGKYSEDLGIEVYVSKIDFKMTFAHLTICCLFVAKEVWFPYGMGLVNCWKRLQYITRTLMGMFHEIHCNPNILAKMDTK